MKNTETKTILRKRLSNYKKLLKTYLFAEHIFINKLEHSTKLDITGALYATKIGLCFAIDYLIEDFHVSFFEVKYPELYAQKPIKTHSDSYWFLPGNMYSRIECIKKAIELTQSKIDNYGV